jgi:hypothetical protein
MTSSYTLSISTRNLKKCLLEKGLLKTWKGGKVRKCRVCDLQKSNRGEALKGGGERREISFP